MTSSGKPVFLTRVSFTVAAKPIGKERPRVTRRGTYTPQKTRAYEAAVRAAFIEAVKGDRLFSRDRVVHAAVSVCANFRVPVSWTNGKKAAAYNAFCTKKPDADNIAKAVCDALNGVAYPDDACIVSLTVDKYWSGEGEDDSVDVTVELWTAI